MRSLANWAVIYCMLAASMSGAGCGDEAKEPSDPSAAGATGDDDDDSATGGKSGDDDDDDSATGGKSGDDDDDDSATGGTSGDDDDDSATGGKSGDDDDDSATGGTSGDDDDDDSATGGTSGDDDDDDVIEPAVCDLSVDGTADLDHEKLPLLIDSDMTLSSDTVWELNDKVHVADGATLTIEPCTRIEGSKDPIGVLIIDRGAQIDADGKADQPILFTSSVPEGDRAEGDWGGVILLGNATNFKGSDVLIEGLDDEPENKYGGSNDDDNSGVMRYVRIEFGGYELTTDVEINGLTLGSVGSGTVIENVMVNTTKDDCFEWFGGTVNAKNLVCNNGGDDMFDVDQGYRGQLTNLFGRQVYPISENPNGLEMDSDLGGATPVTDAGLAHVTLCGLGEAGANASYGMVLREGFTGMFEDLVATGFDFGVDLRDPDTAVDITSSALFNMVIEDVGEPEEEADDEATDEDEWFAAESTNTTADQGFTAEDCLAENGPNSAVTESGVGAFADDADWLQGSWVSWETE